MFRRLVIALMLMAAPFAQARVVLVCAMMDSRIVEQCCCDNERGSACAASENAVLSDCCCAVTIDAGEDFALNAVAGLPDKKQFNDPADGSPDLVAASLPRNTAARHSASQASRPFQAAVENGTKLYLLTARLRL